MFIYGFGNWDWGRRGGNERTNPFGKSNVVVNALATVNTVGDIKSPLYLSHRRRETFALGANTNLYPPKKNQIDVFPTNVLRLKTSTFPFCSTLFFIFILEKSLAQKKKILIAEKKKEIRQLIISFIFSFLPPPPLFTVSCLESQA